MLKDKSKTSKGVNCQKKQYHVLVKKDVDDDCFAGGDDAHCLVGFVVPSKLLLIIFL